MKKLIHILIFASLFLVYWTTDIVNRTEADTAFEHAHQVEQGGVDWLYHPSHLLFGAVSEDLYQALRLVGYGGRAESMLRLLSSLSAAGAVLLFFRFCYRRFSMRPVSSLLCAGLLAFSYGYWRYAMEATVFLPSCFLMLWAMYVTVRPQNTAIESASCGLLCGISVLFHIINAVPVFLAVPLFYLLHRNARGLLACMATAAGTVLLGYGAIGWFEDDRVLRFAGLLHAPESGGLLKGFIAFSQCVVSSNFLLGVASVRSRLVALFPGRMLLEELYLGATIAPWHVALAFLTLLLLLGFFAASVVLAARHLLRRDGEGRRRERVAAVEGWRAIVVVAMWWVAYAVSLLFMDVGNPEFWVMGLVPFWLLFCGLVAAPLSRDNRLWLILCLVLSLWLHNYVGGMLPLRNPAGDYNGRKAEWVLEHAGPDDVIITAANPVFERYLRYYARAGVEYLHDWKELHYGERLRELVRQRGGGKVYVMGDVFAQEPPMRVRFPDVAGRVDELATWLQGQVALVHEDEFGGVWMVE